MKKILIIHESLNIGGAETLLTNILPHLDSSEYEIDLLILHKGGVLTKLLPSNIKVNYYFSNIFKYYLWKILIRFGIFINYYHIQTNKYDCILSFMEGPASVVHKQILKGGKRNVTWIHTDFKNNHWSLKYFHNIKTEYEYYSKMNKIIFVSEAAKRNFDLVYKINESNKKVLTNSVDKNVIRNKSNLIKLKKEKFTICNVGRLEPPKRQDRIIYIAKYLKEKGYDFHFWIVGAGKEEQTLQTLIKNNNVENNVFLLGYKSNPYPYIKNSDVFLLTSDYEGYPMVLCEALCLGMPIISTKVTGAEEMLSNNIGILCNKKEDEIANSIIELYLNDEKRKQISNNALIASEKFSFKTYINNFLDILLV